MKTDLHKKLKIQSLLSVLLAVIGIVLMTFMIIVESEPGALPLLLILVGAGWYFITKFKIELQHVA